MCYFRILLFFTAIYALALTSCSGLDDDGGSPNGSNVGGESTAGVVAGSGSGGSIAAVDSGTETVQGGMSGASPNAGTGGAGGTTANVDASRSDSSIKDAGAGTGGQESGAAGTRADSTIPPSDASSVVTEGGVQPPLSTESCSEEHAEPGCNNAETQACVCERLPDCCTVTWDLPCMLIVTQRFCEPGIRECVCGPETEGGCEQPQCCETEWTDLCDAFAAGRCVGKESCF